MGPYNYEWRFSYNGPGNYGAPVSSSKSYTQSFPECTHYVKLTVASGSETDVAIQPVYVYSGYAKSTTAEDEQAGAKVEAPKPSKAGPERTTVTLAVYDLMGRKVATLDTGTRSAGTHRPRLDATVLPSGTYIVRLRAGEVQKSRRITVVK